MGKLIPINRTEAFSYMRTPWGELAAVRQLKDYPLWRRTERGAMRFDSWLEAKGLESLIFAVDQMDGASFTVFDVRHDELVLRSRPYGRTHTHFRFELHPRFAGVPERDCVVKAYMRDEWLDLRKKAPGILIEGRAFHGMVVEWDGPHHRQRAQAAYDAHNDMIISDTTPYSVHRITSHYIDLFPVPSAQHALMKTLEQPPSVERTGKTRTVLAGWRDDGWRVEMPDGSLL